MKHSWHVLLRRLETALRSEALAVLVVTVSVQGLVVGGQLLAALVVPPEQLGQIRWLESAFAIVLLAASCGMPSIAFREAALARAAQARGRFLIRAASLSSIGGLTMVVGCALVALAFSGTPSAGSWVLLLSMASCLIPANAGRIAVAVVQGAQLSRQHFLRLLAFSVAAVAALAIAAAWAGPVGWVAMRLLVEAALAWLLFRALLSGVDRSALWQWPGWSSYAPLLKTGASANYGFLVRALADNLPVLLLRVTSMNPAELGWFGLANLLLFAPMLLLSVSMQSRLPALIRSTRNPKEFSQGLSAALRALLRTAVLWTLAMLLVALAIHRHWILPNYTQAALPLALLAAGLPARALVLTAGGAAVVHGWFVPGSVLAIVEIVIVTAACLLGAVEAVQLAMAVTIAQIAAGLPSLLMLRAARAACQ